jgi:starch phosphorylase
MMPEKFSNKTNGVTPRRFMVLSNPGLSRLITRSIGDRWITDLDELRRLEAFAEEQDFKSEWRQVKHENKQRLAELVYECAGISPDPDSLFDIQVKRIHEYKRQHLNVLHIITLYNRIKKNPEADVTPRTMIFGGKAAPGYVLAKLIIKLINAVAEVVNTDPAVRDRLKVAFLPDLTVKSGQLIYPAADVSEQISTAGKEASGTGNMKFSMNGALTIGTLDGANIEIREAVGAENFFLFGLTAQQVKDLKARGYNPREYYHSDEQLHQAIDQIRSGVFSQGDTQLFEPLVDALLERDEYMVMADYRSYLECQEKVGHLYQDQNQWTRAAIVNVSRMGKFSSDRSIREYCQHIWRTRPVPIELAPLEI